MNYLPFCGYHFYGASVADERASFVGSYGLLDDSPAIAVARRFFTIIKDCLTSNSTIGNF